MIAQRLNGQLVRHRWKRKWSAGRGFRGILTALTVDMEQSFRLGIVWLKGLITDRPRRGDAILVAQLPEIALATNES